MGIGASEEKLDNAKTLLKRLTGKEVAYTKARRRLPEFSIRKDQRIGAVVTLRGKPAKEFLARALDANSNAIVYSSIARNSVNFGVKEYIYFSGVKYDPKLGMLGLNVNASFARKGLRVERRKRKTSKIPARHREITREEIAKYLEKGFGAKVVEKE